MALERRSNLITSSPILTLLFICTYCFAQHTQMNMQWHKDDAHLKGDNGGRMKICLIASKLEDKQSQFFQWPKIEKPVFLKPNRITAPAYTLRPLKQRPDTNYSGEGSESGQDHNYR
ncbi:uncharacterized protein LOC123210121 [Mangifera indica]|uniref:uncharacterized protein LOC123210121 n=1 Tax=Mangifera indica TaxID=29780 RepID=UPI001CFBF5BF|nr:uncharacterized protein LOC123210121 [Mangifera indica]